MDMNVNKIKKAVIREDLLDITGDYRKAIILNQFIYWSERVADADKFIEKENEIAQSNGEETRELFYGWIYKSADEMADEIMLGLSASQVRKYIGSLVDMGYLSKRNNPKYKWDRTLQYRVNLVNIAKDLKEKGYSLSDYKITMPDSELLNTHQCAINKAQSSNQILSDNGAIPEITTENTNNRKYHSETTTSNKASTNVEVNYKALSRTKQDKGTENLPYEYSYPQFENFIKDKVSKIVNQNFPDEQAAIAPICRIISYFYQRYYEVMGERHPILRDVSYMSIILKLLEPLDCISDCGYRLDAEVYEVMIDDFFGKEFGKHSGLKTDYRISFFMSDGVQEKLCYRANKVYSI